MFANKYMILIALLFVAVAAGVSLAQTDTGIRGEEVTITRNADTTIFYAEGVTPAYTTDISPPDCPTLDSITFFNSTGDQILRIRNTDWPDGAGQMQQYNGIMPLGKCAYRFCCDSLKGAWEFTVEKDDPQGTPSVKVNVRVNCAAVPTITNWGVLILVLLVAASGIWILARKRLAHKGGLA